MRFSWFAVSCLLWIGAAGVPAHGASKTLLENEKVRVVQADDQPHSASAPHRHAYNRVMIYLQAGSQRITPEGGAPAVLQWRAGEVKWSPAGPTHVSEVISDRPVTMIEVEFKKEGDPSRQVTTALDPPKVDAKDYHVEFENSQVRVLRVRMAPKRSVPLHEHQLDRVMVYLTGQNSRITTVDGKSETAHHNAGEVSWGGAAKRREENLLDSPFEAIVVELKY